MFRRLITLAVSVRSVRRARPLGAGRAREDPRRRQDDDDLRGRPAHARSGLERADGARRREPRRRVLLPRDRDRIRPLRGPDRPLPGRRLQRLELQGERRLPAGRRRPGHDQGRRHRALVLDYVHPAGRLADAARCKRRAGAATATRCSPRTTSGRRPGRQERRCSSTGAASRPLRARVRRPAPRPRTRVAANAVRSNALR